MAQDVEDSSPYIRRFPDRFQLKVFSQFEPVTIRIMDDAKKRVDYRHNERPVVGVGTIIANIQILASIKLPKSLSRNPDVYGNPDFNDFQLQLNGKRMVGNFDYQYRKGFYLSNTKNLPELSGSDPFLVKDLSLEGASLNLAYIFNPDKFSYRAIITHIEKQKKSAGSFILEGSIRYFKMSGGSSLFPSEYQEEFNAPDRLNKGKLTGVAIMPGYTYTFVLGDFYLNIGLAVGPDLQYKEYHTGESSQNDFEYEWKVEPKVNVRGGLGYDNGDFFTGIYAHNRQNRYSFGDLGFVYDPSSVRLSVGHRFQETRWMQAFWDWKVYQWVRNLF